MKYKRYKVHMYMYTGIMTHPFWVPPSSPSSVTERANKGAVENLLRSLYTVDTKGSMLILDR